MAELRYDGQVIVVTDAGSELGNEAKFCASRRAKIIMNDPTGNCRGDAGGSSGVGQLHIRGSNSNNN